MTVRVAVIGTGQMGADHAKIVAESLPNATLQVVCDANKASADEVAKTLGAAEAAYDAMEVINNPNVDAIILATPDDSHAPLSLACIKAGKKVLCEKPLSQSSDECLEVMAAEQAAGQKFVQVGFMRRYDQSYVEMKAALDQGTLGYALIMHNFHRNVEIPVGDFTGAMAITNSAPHEFDVVRHVLGVEYATISAYQPKRTDTSVAPVVMVLETTDGRLATIEINNNAAYGYDVRAELIGEKGSIAMNPIAYTRLDQALSSSTRYDADWRTRYAEAYRRQNAAFMSFAETGQMDDTGSDSWDGYCAARVAETGVEALVSGAKASVTLIDKPAFYA